MIQFKLMIIFRHTEASRSERIAAIINENVPDRRTYSQQLQNSTQSATEASSEPVSK